MPSETNHDALSMNRFWAIFRARNIEFYRDKGAFGWAIVFPLLIIFGCAIAFSNPDNSVVKIGYWGSEDLIKTVTVTQENYVNLQKVKSLESGKYQVQHHQLDLLIHARENDIAYWVNDASAPSQAAKALLLAKDKKLLLHEQIVSGRAVRYVDWVMPGVLGMNMMFASLFGVGYVIVRYRQNGVLKRLQATPVTATQFISAQLSSRLLIVIGINSSIFLACYFLLDLLVLGSLLNLLLINIAGAIALLSVGLLVASRTASEELASGILNVLTWPMMFFSQVWFSLENSPQWMITVAQFLPLTHIVDGSRKVMIEGAGLADLAYPLAMLGLMTAVCVGAAAYLFRWSKD